VIAHTLRRVVEQGMRENVAPEVQRALDDIYQTHKGEPVEQVKSALQQRWASIGQGWNLTDPNLTAYAQAISEGRRIEVRVEPSG
jgi:biotin-(acetyl-CoA carboxylase) ligase